MKTLKFYALIIILLLVLSETGVASCLKTPPTKEEAGRSDLVFIGTVIKTAPAQFAVADLIDRKRLRWQMSFSKNDVVTFKVVEAFKGDVGETIEIATSADGAAGYKFDGGTWLKANQTYLVYANRLVPAGTVETQYSPDEYAPEVIAEFQRIEKSLPKALAAEVNEYNKKLSGFYAGICGRTKHIDQADEEVLQLRGLFPESQRFAAAGTSPGAFVFRKMLAFLHFA